MAKKLLQDPTTFNLLTINGGGSSITYTGVSPVIVEGQYIKLEDSATTTISDVSNKLPKSVWDSTTGNFAQQSDINGIYSEINNNIIPQITDISTNVNNLNNSVSEINSNVYELSSNYNIVTSDLNDLQSDFTDFTNIVNANFENVDLSIDKLSGDIVDLNTRVDEINSFTGVNTNLNITGDGLNSPLGVPYADYNNNIDGVVTYEDKFKLDNIDLVGLRNPDTFSGMQLTYVGSPNSSTNTFLGYINDVNSGQLGFYDLTGYSLDDALSSTEIITNTANWVEHPFGLSPEMFNTLSTLYNLLSDSANHPNAMLGTTATESGVSFGWIDLG